MTSSASTNELYEKLKTLIPILHTGMEKFRPLPFVGDVRCIGLLGAIELVRNKETRAAFDPAERVGQKVFNDALRENLILLAAVDLLTSATGPWGRPHPPDFP